LEVQVLIEITVYLLS